MQQSLSCRVITECPSIVQAPYGGKMLLLLTINMHQTFKKNPSHNRHSGFSSEYKTGRRKKKTLIAENCTVSVMIHVGFLRGCQWQSTRITSGQEWSQSELMCSVESIAPLLSEGRQRSLAASLGSSFIISAFYNVREEECRRVEREMQPEALFDYRGNLQHQHVV